MPNIRRDRWLRVITAGEHMSNWFFNMYQVERDPRTKEAMKQMVDEWDKSRRAQFPPKQGEAKHE